LNPAKAAPQAPIKIAASAITGSEVSTNRAVARMASQPMALASGAFAGAPVIAENS